MAHKKQYLSKNSQVKQRFVHEVVCNTNRQKLSGIVFALINDAQLKFAGIPLNTNGKEIMIEGNLRKTYSRERR